MMSSLKPSASVRLIVCALWQSLQTGSSLSVFPSSVWWTLCSNCSWIPWWHAPQVVGTFARLTLEAGVGARQDAVGRVAARAGRGHDQPALQQALAVDALGVGLDDLVLRPLVAHRGLLALPVAPGAQQRDVGRKRGRGGREAAGDAVGPVALLARGGVRVAVEEQLAVAAARELLRELGVARAAVHLLRDRLAGPRARGVDPRVALRARHLRVARALRPRRRSRRRTGRRPPSHPSARGTSGSRRRPCPACRRPCAPCAAGGSRRTRAARAPPSPTARP